MTSPLGIHAVLRRRVGRGKLSPSSANTSVHALLPPSRPPLAIRTLQGKQSHKLTVRQRQYALELLARHPHEPSKIVEQIRQQVGVVLTVNAIKSLRAGHEAEIAQMRAEWLGALPALTPKDRIEELVALLELKGRALFRVACATCVGRGIVNVVLTKVEAKAAGEGAEKVKPASCPACRGRRWVMDADAGKALKVLKAAGGRLLPSVFVGVEELAEKLPLDVPTELLDDFTGLLTKIREEMGDAWSPKERGQVSDPGAAGQQQTVVVLAGDTAGYVARLRALREKPVLDAAPTNGDGKEPA